MITVKLIRLKIINERPSGVWRGVSERRTTGERIKETVFLFLFSVR